MHASLPESGAVPRASSSRHRPEYSRHSLCREGTLGTAHSAPLGRHKALCREPPQMLSAHVCREPLGSRQRKFFQIKKISSATRATGQHRRPHRSVATVTPAPLPSPPQMRCPHHHSTTAAARAPPPPLPRPHRRCHHCHAHTAAAEHTPSSPPPPSRAHHHRRCPKQRESGGRKGRRSRRRTWKREKVAVAPGRIHKIRPRPPGRSRRGGATRLAVGEPPSSLELLPWRGRRGGRWLSDLPPPRLAPPLLLATR
jgi:hypothetical protein